MQINKKTKFNLDSYLERATDIKFIGQICFVIIVLLISWSGVKSIQSNYSLQKQITSLNQQNDLQKLQNDNLQLQNNYYNSNQYLELSARENFGLAAPGETEIIVPEQAAMAQTITPTNFNSVTKIYTSKAQNNLSSWVSFFLHRQSNN
jgi:cell division protein FtsB